MAIIYNTSVADLKSSFREDPETIKTRDKEKWTERGDGKTEESRRRRKLSEPRRPQRRRKNTSAHLLFPVLLELFFFCRRRRRLRSFYILTSGATQGIRNSAAMWASNATLALLTCPNRAACACTLSPSVSFLSHANSASSSFELWRRTGTPAVRLVRVMNTADLDSGTGAVEVEEPVKIDRVSEWPLS